MTENAAEGPSGQSGGMAEAEEAAGSTFWGYIGCEMVSSGEGRAAIRLEIRPHHLNLLGLVHGGVLATLLDNAMALAAMQICPGEKLVTAQMNIYYLRSIGAGTITCAAELVHRSRRTFTLMGELRGDDGGLLAWGSGSFRLVT